MALLARQFRYADGVRPNVIALTYTLCGYGVGVALLFAHSWLWNALGTLLVAHTLVYTAYFIHEFAHGAIFMNASTNSAWGVFMTWINGSCYAPFSDLRRKHMRHHVDRADVITFDFKAFLQRSPAWFRKLVLLLEWAYIPAVEYIMRAYVMAIPFLAAEKRSARGRIVMVFLVRSTVFGLLAWYAPKAFILYAVAHIMFVTVLRFADAYQHTYDAFAMLSHEKIPEDKVRDKTYEQSNTYSNVVSLQHPLLNLLLLNFSYHNAHHEKPAMPWHRLPQMHRELFDPASRQVIPMKDLLKSFHKYRVARVMQEDYGVVGDGPGRADSFIGAVGVSFLTAV